MSCPGAADLPGLFIAGAPKSGTSSVFRWLDDHPDAQGSDPKEPCFFADPGSHVFRPDFNAGTHDLDTYRRAAFGPGPAAGRLRFEATASHIYSATALARIPDLPGAPKCLFLLREPAAQILSTYTYFRNNWAAIPAEMGFADYLGALRRGGGDFGDNELVRDALAHARYVDWLLPWRARLGPGRMRVRTFEAMRADPAGFMADLAHWCGRDPGFYEGYGFAAENESYAPRSRGLQRLNIALRHRLPRGRLYRAARGLYRRLNTTAPGRGGADAGAMAGLAAEFAADNRRLAAAFDLELPGWTT